MIPRGIRNNNPGNIRHGEPWQGLAEQQDDPAFCTFVAPEWGIRAICKILQSYAKRGVTTVASIIHEWAPPNENDTKAYVAAVAAGCDVDPTQVVDVKNYAVCYPLVCAIIKHENGEQPYPKETIDKGLALAGVEP